MNSLFYAKLAFINLKKNKDTYVPYMIACIGTVFTYFLLMALSNNKGMKNIPDSESLQILFQVGGYVVAIFSVIFVFYANSFLMKRRKKEIGLYGILGLEKRHVAYVMFYEMLFMGVISLLLGIFFGIVFGKLSFLILLQVLQVSKESKFLVDMRVLGNTTLLFSVLFLASFLINFIQVKTSSPIILLQSDKEGEKEPKASWIITLLGFVTLGYGYYNGLFSKSIMNSIGVFFIAVIAVVIGTYALFTSGSIAVLKWLKKKKKIYYTPNYFIAISNMIYRMKKNAAGLASICILSTMVLVVMSATISLFAGKEDMLRNRNGYDFTIMINENNEDTSELLSLLEETAQSNQIDLKEGLDYYEINIGAVYSDGVFMRYGSADTSSTFISFDTFYELRLISLEDYNRLGGSNKSLEKNQVFLFCETGQYKEQELNLSGNRYQIKEKIDSFEPVEGKFRDSFSNVFHIVVKDKETMMDLFHKIYQNEVSSTENVMVCSYRGNLKGSHENKVNFAEDVSKNIKGELEGVIRIGSYDQDLDTWNSLYGGLLFLGVVLGILFIMAMVLIIYFKQVSEGYEDRIRFDVMQKVGMSQDEIKDTIYKQIKMVFILPVAGAILHTIVAFPILKNLLLMFGFHNAKLMGICFAGVIGVFTILYLIVYQFTARVYNRIVEKK